MNAFQLYKQREESLASLPVNPDFLEAGDIITISGTPGLWVTGKIDNERGTLIYRPLSSGLCEYKGEASIRMCKLVSRPEPCNGDGLPYQTEFPFIKELVTKAIEERNEELTRAMAALEEKRIAVKKKEEKKSCTSNPLDNILEGASLETLEKILLALKGKGFEEEEGL